MSKHHYLPADRVRKSAASLRTLLPQYETLLFFYEQVFVAQEDSALQVSMDPIVIGPEIVRLKNREKLPLLEITEFGFDPLAGQDLLIRLCHIIKTSDNEMSPQAGQILAAVEQELEIEPLFQHLLNGDDTYFDGTAARIGCDKNTLAFVVYNSLKPSLAVCAEQLAPYLTDRTEWKSGFCPICGNQPVIAVMDEEGRRHLYCCFCWHAWPAPRVFCPYCANTDGKTLNYLYSENEKSLRVDCCEKCRKYIKAVDTRSSDRPIYAPLEQVASLHLDIKARQSGFASGIPLPLPTE